MRPSGGRGAESELRGQLLEQEKAFCTQMVSTMLNDGTEAGRYAFDALHPRVAALTNGDEVRAIHGWELPEGHWARGLGLNRDWTLGADDVLRPYQPPPGPRFVPPLNRKQRREAGWRGRRD